MNRKLDARSLFFALSFSLWFGMTMPALGAMGTDDFFVLVESRTETALSIFWQMFLSAPAKTPGSSFMQRCKAGGAMRTFPSGCTVTGGCWRDVTEGP